MLPPLALNSDKTLVSGVPLRQQPLVHLMGTSGGVRRRFFRRLLLEDLCRPGRSPDPRTLQAELLAAFQAALLPLPAREEEDHPAPALTLQVKEAACCSLKYS